MRRTGNCILSLILLLLVSCFNSQANAGDLLPPDCCKFFCDANFTLDANIELVSSSRRMMRRSSSSSSSKKTAVAITGLRLTPSKLKWNFDYQPVSSVKTAPTVLSFLGAEAQANLAILTRIISNEAGSAFAAFLLPPEHLPERILVTFDRFVSLR